MSVKYEYPRLSLLIITVVPETKKKEPTSYISATRRLRRGLVADTTTPLLRRLLRGLAVNITARPPVGLYDTCGVRTILVGYVSYGCACVS